MSNELKPLPDIALKYLSVPASSVESKRTFNTAGRLTERRARLKNKNVNILVFIKIDGFLILNWKLLEDSQKNFERCARLKEKYKIYMFVFFYIMYTFVCNVKYFCFILKNKWIFVT